MAILSQIFYFIIIIGVLVLVHELGHFLAAKAFGMRVDRFSIGFPPRAFGKKIGETDYCVSWLPIGGYVKIAGMIDESLDTEFLQGEPEPWEFRAKPIWQRFITMIAGVAMNVILAILIFWGLNLSTGKETHKVTTIGFVRPGSIAATTGLQPNDNIQRINNTAVGTWEDIEENIYIEHLSRDVTIAFLRDNKPQTVTIPKKLLSELDHKRFGMYPVGVYTKVAALEPDQPAAKAGMKEGDIFVSMNGVRIHARDELDSMVRSHPSRPLATVWTRNGKEMSAVITPTSDGLIRIIPLTEIPGEIIVEKYGTFEALGIGVRSLSRLTVMFLDNIWSIIIGKASFRNSIGGPVKIAEMAAKSAQAGLANFMSLMALLSMSLAIINIFPIPALDGGHVVFLAYEAIFRKEVPNKVRLFLQQAGMVILLAFMVFVLYNDIFH
jgi:regulator of sigma E protease